MDPPTSRNNINIILMILLIFLHCVDLKIVTGCPNKKIPLEVRKKRYVYFPEASNVVLTVSLAKAIQVHAPSGWNVVMELDMLHKLPDRKFSQENHRKKLHYRQKREFWDNLSETLFLHNMNGHACVMRSVCEAKTHLAPLGKSLVHDLVRAIFSNPSDDADELDELGSDYKPLREENFCEKSHGDECPVSLLHFILFLNKIDV